MEFVLFLVVFAVAGLSFVAGGVLYTTARSVRGSLVERDSPLAGLVGVAVGGAIFVLGSGLSVLAIVLAVRRIMDERQFDAQLLLGAATWSLLILPLVVGSVLLILASWALVRGTQPSHSPRRAELGGFCGLAVVMVCFWLIGLIAWPVMAGFLRMFKLQTLARQASLLWVLAIGTRQPSSTVSELEVLARMQPRGYATRLQRLATRLARGERLPQALRHVRSLLPKFMVFELAVADEARTLTAALPRMATELADESSSASTSDSDTFAGLLLLTILVLSVVATLFFSRLSSFYDTHVLASELPPLTRWSMELFRGTSFLTVPVLLLAVFVGLCVGMVGFLVWLVGREETDLWILEKLCLRSSSPFVLRAVATGMEGGMPLKHIFALAAHEFPRISLRSNLRKVAEHVDAGGDVWDGLVAAGFLARRETDLLRAADRMGNTPWALRELATGIVRRRRYRNRLAEQVLRPAAVVGLGLVVGTSILVVFLPLISLLQQEL